MSSLDELIRKADEEINDRENASEPSFMARLSLVLLILTSVAGIVFSIGVVKSGSTSWDGAFWRPLLRNWMESLEWNKGWPAGQWIVWFWVGVSHFVIYGMYYLFKGVPRNRSDGDYWLKKDTQKHLDDFWASVIGIQMLLAILLFFVGLVILGGKAIMDWFS